MLNFVTSIKIDSSQKWNKDGSLVTNFSIFDTVLLVSNNLFICFVITRDKYKHVK